MSKKQKQVKIIETQKASKMSRHSSKQILQELKSYTTQRGNLPASQAIESLLSLLEDGKLDDTYIPVLRIEQDVNASLNGRITKDELLIRLMIYLDSFGAVARDVEIAEQVAIIARELEEKERELAMKALTFEIDFREIPAAHGGRDRDMFELFARDFLEALQFEIVQGPDRGSDGGKDLIVVGAKPGAASQRKLKWIVSCKHKAHGGGAVTPSVEAKSKPITDRVMMTDYDGFVGFYSTVPSSGLVEILEGLKTNYSKDYFIFDRGNIAMKLISEPLLEGVLEQYFPNAYRRKKLGQIEVNLELLKHLWHGEFTLRAEKALRRNDALLLRRAQVEYEAKASNAEKQYSYLVEQFSDKERKA